MQKNGDVSVIFRGAVMLNALTKEKGDGFEIFAFYFRLVLGTAVSRVSLACKIDELGTV
jgi:hypothetical protein